MESKTPKIKQYYLRTNDGKVDIPDKEVLPEDQ